MFYLVLYGFPIIIIIYSIIGYVKLKKWYVAPLFTVIVGIVATYTIFHSSRLFITYWVPAYTLLSVVATVITMLVNKIISKLVKK